MEPQQLLLFGDQTVETLPSIRNLVLQSRASPSLLRFLSEATDVVQTQASRLNEAERRRFFDFTTILDLAEGYAKQEEPDDLVATVLMCIAQLGELIIYGEKDPAILGSSHSKVHIFGFCTGLLPAAVAAAATDTSEVVRLGVEIVSVAFRLALETSHRARQIEEAPGCWGFSVINVSPEDQQTALDEFNRNMNVPPHRYAYLSVLSQTWATVSGPPSVLADLFSTSPVFEDAPKLKLPFGAAAHAPHLPLPDVEKVVGTSPLHNTPITSKSLVMSTSSCETLVASNLRTLLYQIIQDIVQNTLRLSSTVDAMVKKLHGKGDIKLTAVGPTSHSSMIQKAFEAQGSKVVLTSQAEALPADNIRGGSNLVAIVGMSGRFPGSDNIQEFWETLLGGLDVHKRIPKDRFDLDTHYDPTGEIKNTTTVPYGCFLDNPGHFDSRLFNVSPREAAQMDPIQRLLLMTSYEALEMAGYTKGGTLSTESKRIATYFGQAADDWREINASQETDVYYVPALARAFAPGRLNYHYKWEGASYSLDSACASSSSAVILACKALLSRDCDTALAGGGSVLTAPPPYAGLSRGGFLSTTGGCKTFRDDADGYCRGEGVGVVVLKRLEDAIADNDNIQAVIRGAARNYSAGSTSITHPDPEAQQSLYKQVLQQAGVGSNDIGFVEMHGTATQAGDLAEMTSVTNVFGKTRTRDNPLVVGAVKANIGHGEAAAGAASLIKTVLMLRENTIPPQPGMPRRINSKFPPLEKMNVRIADAKIPFNARAKGDGKRKMLLNNFDAAGGNTCLLIEDPPAVAQKGQDPRSYHVVAVSARTSKSMRSNKQRLLDYLTAHPETRLSDLAYTTTARRMHDVFRDAYPAQTTQDVVRSLSASLASSTEAKRTSTKGAVVFTFTGQGSQYTGMGKELFGTCTRFRETILSYQNLCDWQGLPSFVELIAHSEADLKAKSTVQVQLAIVALELALADLWRSWGVQPDLVIGHSLGEYAALCVSGVLSVSDTLYLVGKRASLLQDKCTPGSHAMLAVGASPSILEEALGAQHGISCQVACMNSPNATVFSGTVEDIKTLQTRLEGPGVRSKLLQVPYGFHSPQLDPILPDFESVAKGIPFAKPTIPIASTLKAAVVTDAGVFSADYLVRQARDSVNFAGALQAIKAAGLADDKTLWMEIGPDPVCLGMVRSTLDVPTTRLLPTLKSSEDSWKTVTTTAAALYIVGASLNWTEYSKEYLHSLTLLELPTYSFDLKDYWIPYEGDWALKHTKAAPAPAVAPTAPSMPGFPTTSLQRVASESITEKKVSVTFESLATEPKLLAAIRGHMVNGVALCPSSVFTDMAFTAAKYVHQKAKPKAPVSAMSLEALEITHPLVPNVSNPQTIVVNAIATKDKDWAVDITFSSRDGASHEHGYCRVVFGNSEDWKAEWSKTSFLVKAKVDAVIDSCRAGLGHHLLRPIVYKLFSSLVVYEDDYQGLEEVFMEDDFNDAVANVKLRPSSGTGQFTHSPYWTDAIVHLAGFILNGNVTNPDDIAFISTGFESLRIAEDLSEDKTYTSYVHMRDVDKKGNTVGDVYVLDGQNVIGLCTGVMFQKMKRIVLDTIIGKAPPAAAPARGGQAKAPAKGSSPPAKSRVQSKKARAAISAALSNLQNMSFAAVQRVIAEEAKVSIDSVVDHATFQDLGVGELEAISISSKTRAMTSFEFPTSVFSPTSTVAKLRAYFEDEYRNLDSDDSGGSGSTSDSEGIMTSSTSDSSVDGGDGADDAEFVIGAIAKQTGFDIDDMEPSTLFSDLGVDSLMSIEIIASIKKETGMVLPATFFNDHPSVAEVRSALGKEPEKEPAHIPAPARVAPQSQTKEHNPVSVSSPAAVSPAAVTLAPTPPALADQMKPLSSYESNVVLLQGRIKSSLTPLFLLCDGAGSATAYIHLPSFSKGQPVYALESPFLHAPLEYKCSIEEVATLYMDAIRKTQPKGPYIIGGWSAGAVYAYEVARRMLEDGDRILGLIFLDMRVPKPMPNSLEPTMDLLEASGLTTGINRAGVTLAPMSAKLKQHLLSTVRALLVYKPTPMDPARRPDKVSIIWARYGLSEVLGEGGAGGAAGPVVTKEPDAATKKWFYGAEGKPDGAVNVMEDADSGMMSWFYAPRKAFGANGWNSLVGENIECNTVEADHFSMVNYPAAKVTGQFLREAVEKCKA